MTNPKDNGEINPGRGGGVNLLAQARMLLEQIWPMGVGGVRTIHLVTAESPTSPDGVPVVMQKYTLHAPASGRPYWFKAGISGTHAYVYVDPNHFIMHFEPEA